MKRSAPFVAVALLLGSSAGAGAFAPAECPPDYKQVTTAAAADKCLKTIDQLEGWINAWHFGSLAFRPFVFGPDFEVLQVMPDEDVIFFTVYEVAPHNAQARWRTLAAMGYSRLSGKGFGWTSVVKDGRTLLRTNFEDRWLFFDDLIAAAETEIKGSRADVEEALKAAPLSELPALDAKLSALRALKDFRGAMKAVESRYRGLLEERYKGKLRAGGIEGLPKTPGFDSRER